MPELPEVEAIRRSLGPLVTGVTVTAVVVRERRLRWPVWRRLNDSLTGRAIDGVDRRGKYLLIRIGAGTLIVHFGMSGSFRYVDASTPARPHDHLDLVLGDGHRLRFHDPRRFGCVLWTSADARAHRLLKHLGPEPLAAEFAGEYLHRRAAGRMSAVKTLLMDARIVAGVGNIYANEALFACGIHPSRRAGRISLPRYERLVADLKRILEAAILHGGTTLRDHVNPTGQPGDFRLRLEVYGRSGESCPRCGHPIRSRVIGQRSTFFCVRCQH